MLKGGTPGSKLTDTPSSTAGCPTCTILYRWGSVGVDVTSLFSRGKMDRMQSGKDYHFIKLMK